MMEYFIAAVQMMASLGDDVMRFSPNILIIFLAVFIAISGCSSTRNEITAPATHTPRQSNQSSHQCWGIYQFIVDAEAEKLDALPIRAVSMHLNALTFLEPPPNSNLRLESIQFNGNIIDVEIGLRHPFLGMIQFTGFDVCGVLISHGSTGGFNDSDLVLPGEEDFRLLNPDGYTRWWNPVEFPLNDGTMFCYKDGLLGTPDAVANFTATLNGYKYFCDDLDSEDPMIAINPFNRGMFSAGKKNIRHYTIEMGSSGITFNYAIDASWEFPTGTPPWEAPDSFKPQANRPEAWFISTYIEENSLWNDGTESGGHLRLVWFRTEHIIY